MLALDIGTNTLKEARSYSDVGPEFMEEYVFCPSERLISFCDALRKVNMEVVFDIGRLCGSPQATIEGAELRV